MTTNHNQDPRFQELFSREELLMIRDRAREMYAASTADPIRKHWYELSAAAANIIKDIEGGQ